MSYNRGKEKPKITYPEIEHTKQRSHRSIDIKTDLQRKVNKSPQVQQARDLQRKADKSPQVQQARDLQRKADKFIQVKYKISNPTDPSEKEATRIASQVTGIIHPVKSVDTKGVFRKENEDSLSAQASIPERIDSAVSSSGSSLPSGLQGEMESKMGHDFSQVKVHNNQKAHGSAAAINAKAYTKGNDIVFAKGEYNPGSSEGRHLIAHELAHVIQQGPDIYREGAPSATQNEIYLALKIIINEWLEAFEVGVNQFVTSALIKRIKNLESGSWSSFLLGLVGNTMWAATAFFPPTATLAAFGISMAGIGIAMLPSIPSSDTQSDDLIEILQRQMYEYAVEIAQDMKDQCEGIAGRIKKSNRNISLIEATNLFLESTFHESYLDKTRNSIQLEQNKVARGTKKYAEMDFDIITRISKIDTKDMEYPKLPGVENPGADWMDLVKFDEESQYVAYQYGHRMVAEIEQPNLAEQSRESNMLFTHRGYNYSVAPTHDYVMWFIFKIKELASRKRIAEQVGATEAGNIVNVSLTRLKQILDISQFRTTMEFAKNEGIKKREQLKLVTISHLRATRDMEVREPSENQLKDVVSLHHEYIDPPRFLSDYEKTVDRIIGLNLLSLENIHEKIDNVDNLLKSWRKTGVKE